MADATVRIRNAATGEERHTKIDVTGLYSLPSVAPGTNSISGNLLHWRSEMRLKSSLSSALLGLFLAGSLPAQQAGSVNGVLTDPSGAAVPGAKVMLTATATGISRYVSTGQGGLYNFSELNSGEYSVTAEATVFKRAVSNVRVEVNRTVRLDLKLELGAATEQVEVNAAPSTLQMADSQVGGVAETKAISDLHLNGRNFTQLMVLMASVEAPPWVTAEFAQQESSRTRLLHLVDFEFEHPLKDVAVWIRALAFVRMAAK
jgi:Carboxypeptidase regulatory-like domain